MQTFLPFANFKDCAYVLDSKRLGNQRNEVLYILKTNRGLTKYYKNHPACVMWRGYEDALCLYGAYICSEWVKRGFSDSQETAILAFKNKTKKPVMPDWLGNENLHVSHRRALLIKNYEWYKQFKWPEDNPISMSMDIFSKIEYWWPSSNT